MSRVKRKYTTLLHICIWSVLFSCIFLIRGWNHGPREGAPTNPQVILAFLPYIGLFYVHGYWLMPVYLYGRKIQVYAAGLAGVILLVVGLAGLIWYLEGLPNHGASYLQSVSKRIGPAILFLVVSLGVGNVRETMRRETLRKEKETEHLRTELSFLRTQVNPHFMLNVLNSMVLLARKKSDLLEPVLLELSRLMTYMLYNTENELIGLEDEIGYLRAYIDLQLLRFGDDVEVRFNVPSPIGVRSIEPMLLIPLVENAFKHGIGLVNDPLILIDMTIEAGDRLIMTVKNKYSPAIRQGGNKPAGIGLSNLTRRLEMTYPGQFELHRTDRLHVGAGESEYWFIIQLNIPLS